MLQIVHAHSKSWWCVCSGLERFSLFKMHWNDGLSRKRQCRLLPASFGNLDGAIFWKTLWTKYKMLLRTESAEFNTSHRGWILISCHSPGWALRWLALRGTVYEQENNPMAGGISGANWCCTWVAGRKYLILNRKNWHFRHWNNLYEQQVIVDFVLFFNHLKLLYYRGRRGGGIVIWPIFPFRTSAHRKICSRNIVTLIVRDIANVTIFH